MLLKRTLFCVFGVMKCVMWFKVQKPHNFPHTVHYCFSSVPHLILKELIFTKLIGLKSEVCSDWPAIQCFVNGAGSPHAKTFTIGSGSSEVLLTNILK